MPSIRTRPESLPLGLLLAAVGGFLDAFTFVGYGGVFANAQTGNIVLTGIETGEQHWRAALLHVPPILAFLLGVTVAEWLGRPAAHRIVKRPTRLALGAEILVLGVAGLVPSWVPDQVVTAAIAFGVGAGVGAGCTHALGSRAAWVAAAGLVIALAYIVIETITLSRRERGGGARREHQGFLRNDSTPAHLAGQDSAGQRADNYRGQPGGKGSGNVAPGRPNRPTVADHLTEECRTSVAGGDKAVSSVCPIPVRRAE